MILHGLAWFGLLDDADLYLVSHGMLISGTKQ
jgi:hypothetical protein